MWSQHPLKSVHRGLSVSQVAVCDQILSSENKWTKEGYDGFFKKKKNLMSNFDCKALKTDYFFNGMNRFPKRSI